MIERISGYKPAFPENADLVLLHSQTESLLRQVSAVAAETSLRGQEASHRESATQLAQMQKDLATMKQAWTREKREVKIAHQELSEMMEKLRECQEAAAEMETQGKEQREAEEEVLRIRRPAGTLASPS
ncbi:hypothetical protein BDZ97DRAFT_188998 [Flammula alnicola]|nr:hypothetical protein BDZ97DRAFT_188998 [Flammula alnicola]